MTTRTHRRYHDRSAGRIARRMTGSIRTGHGRICRDDVMSRSDTLSRRCRTGGVGRRFPRSISSCATWSPPPWSRWIAGRGQASPRSPYPVSPDPSATGHVMGQPTWYPDTLPGHGDHLRQRLLSGMRHRGRHPSPADVKRNGPMWSASSWDAMWRTGWGWNGWTTSAWNVLQKTTSPWMKGVANWTGIGSRPATTCGPACYHPSKPTKRISGWRTMPCASLTRSRANTIRSTTS